MAHSEGGDQPPILYAQPLAGAHRRRYNCNVVMLKKGLGHFYMKHAPKG